MTIALSCPSCDKALKVKDELAGKKVKCPGCGEPILVELADEAVPESAAEEKPRRKVVADEEADERPRKKKKKKKKSNSLLWIALGGGAVLLVLLIGVGVVLLIVFNQPAAETKSTQQAKTKKKQNEQPKFDPLPDNPRPKGGIPRTMDVQELKNAMHNIGLAYHNYASANNKAPMKLQDFFTVMDRNALIETLLKDDGAVVFIYGVRPQDMTQGTTNTILAYEKESDNKGVRVVLYGDGSVELLTDGEFYAKPKAQPRNK
jgi:hypothetical protein